MDGAKMCKILIIEDDVDLQEGLAYSLEEDGYSVVTAATMEAGEEQFGKNACDLILLDCNLPDGSGFEFCKRLRRLAQTPVLMLTARDSELDEVKALNLGADDYLTKPFSLSVLKARIHCLLRRSPEPQLLYSNGITLDKASCRVWRGEEELSFSYQEYRLLLYLMENKGQVLSKAQILSQLWDGQGKFVDENTVSVNIRRLRMKIEKDPARPEMIRTVHGLGYFWREG